MLRLVSLFGLLVMAAAIIGLYAAGSLISALPATVALQAAAIALSIWARLTFGARSFHASAGPTEGGLVTTGPYRWIRHPIYAAACLFGWAGIATRPAATNLALGALLVAGALIRILCEERLVTRQYPAYAEYAKTTKRMIPFVF